MVATKAKTGFTQYIKNKPIKWRIKLFVLADSGNSYTVDFSVYVGKTPDPSAQGLSYNVVMNLVQPDFIGTGYHIYMDNFYIKPYAVRWPGSLEVRGLWHLQGEPERVSS